MEYTEESLLEAIHRYQSRLERYWERKEEAEDKEILYNLRKLKKLPLKRNHFEITGIGNIVSSFGNVKGSVGEAAQALVARWKENVLEEMDKESEKERKTKSSSHSSKSKNYDDSNSKENRHKKRSHSRSEEGSYLAGSDSNAENRKRIKLEEVKPQTKQFSQPQVSREPNPRRIPLSENDFVFEVPLPREPHNELDDMKYTGDVQYSILRPVLKKASANQLYKLEQHNPYLLDDSDELWKLHSQKEFGNKCREELETWRDMFKRRKTDRICCSDCEHQTIVVCENKYIDNFSFSVHQKKKPQQKKAAPLMAKTISSFKKIYRR